LRHAFHHLVALQERRAPSHQLGDAAPFTRAFEYARGDEGHRLRIVELQPLRLPALGEQRSGEDEELVLFSWREFHSRLEALFSLRAQRGHGEEPKSPALQSNPLCSLCSLWQKCSSPPDARLVRRAACERRPQPPPQLHEVALRCLARVS